MVQLKEGGFDSAFDESVTASARKVALAPRARKRRSRLVAVGAVGLALSAGLWAFSGMMRHDARFADDNVARQLSEQAITFKAANLLTPEEREHACLVKFAGQALTTGPQAQCYANHFIGVHLKKVAQGKTFSEMRGITETLRAQITEAQSRNDPAAADLQRELTKVTGQRQSLFEGETMRGLLMTSYGFSVLGTKADQAASASSTAAASALVASIAIIVIGGVVARRSRTSTAG